MNKFKNLKMVHKLTLILAVMALPLAFQVYIFWVAERAAIASTENELRGLRYIVAMRGMFEHVPEHRGEVGEFLAGDLEARELYLALHPVIDAEVVAIDAITQEIGEELRTTELWADIKIRWEQVKTESDTHTMEESFDEHTELINEIHDMMRQIADHSDLTHDPDLDTAYLMDLVVIELPLAIESLEDLRDLGAEVAAKKVMTAEERVKLSVFVGQPATITAYSTPPRSSPRPTPR